MFWPDVIALKEFYGTPLGQMACHKIRKSIRKLWPDAKGDSIVGLGFATPYLIPFMQETKNIFACMPSAQGVIHWPAGVQNLSLLSDEAELPFADNSINRVIIVHALENSEHLRPMMSEIWRVLSPAGRVIVVAPNRRGIWARSPKSPFAHGQPFTAWQLRQLLAEHSFTPLHASAALFFPPIARRFILRSAALLEIIGVNFFSGFGGVIVMEAEKQIYASIGQKSRASKAYIPAIQPQPLGA